MPIAEHVVLIFEKPSRGHQEDGYRPLGMIKWSYLHDNLNTDYV